MDATPAILEAFQHALRSPPPPIYGTIDSEGTGQLTFEKQYVERLELQAAKLEADSATWQQGAELARKTLLSVVRANALEDHHLDLLSQVAQRIERHAEDHAHNYQRLLKKIRRVNKELRRLNAMSGDHADRIIVRVERVLTAELAEYQTMAIFLRALRAEYAPDSRNAVSFADPRELGKYLTQMIQ